MNNNTSATGGLLPARSGRGIDFGVVEILHQAFRDGSRWPDFLASLSYALGARSAALMSLAPANQTTLCVTHSLEAAVARRWQSYFRHLLPTLSRNDLPAQGEHVMFSGTDLVQGESFQGDFYEEFLKPQGLRWQAGAWIKPAAPGAATYGLLLWRDQDQPDFQASHLADLAQVVRLLTDLELIGVANVLGRVVGLGEAEVAGYLLGRDGAMLMANDAGAELMGKHLVIPNGRRIAFASAEADRWLHEQLAQVTCQVDLLNTPVELTEIIAGYGSVEFRLGRLHAIGSSPALTDVCYGLSVRLTRAAAPKHVAQIAQRLYRWTSAEFDTVRRLSEGQPLPAIAAGRQCSVETVRSHLKNAKRKAGVNRQVDLVRLMLSLQQRQ